MTKAQVITTIPPYAPYLAELASHPIVSGFRLNTVMPIKEPLEDLLTRLKKVANGKELWIDLKCRQIRTSRGVFFNSPNTVKTYVIDGKTVILDPSNQRTFGDLRTPPWAAIQIDHKIKLDMSKGPIKCFMNDGYDSAYIAEVMDGDTLIMLDGPEKVIGGGESINILHSSLEIEGFFTPLDYEYIKAAKAAGVHTYMLSFVEKDSDIDELLELDPETIIVAKIESKKGLDWVNHSSYKYDNVRLMAARGDLYVEVERPDLIINAVRTILRNDPTAIVASRILTSLRNKARPTCSDISDIAYLLESGWKYLMIGDDICFNRAKLMLALDIVKAMIEG